MNVANAVPSPLSISMVCTELCGGNAILRIQYAELRGEAYMSSRSLTMSDLLAISGYTRDQMRGLLDAIPAYAKSNTQVRVARQYTTEDLVVIRACSQLESHYGLQRGTVVGFSDGLRSVLSRPRPLSTTASLLLTFSPMGVRYIETTEGIADGLLIPCAPIFQVVDEYLLPGRTQLHWGQQELGFGPQAVVSASSEPAIQQYPVIAEHRAQKRRIS